MPDLLSRYPQVVARGPGEMFFTRDTRPEASVKLRSRANASDDNWSSFKRQRQFPSAQPGTFMRLSAPKFRRSCIGAIVSAASDHHAKLINSEAASPLSPGVRLR